MTAKKLEKSGLEAIKLLRLKRLQQGLPFMINSGILPSEECYLEYPDGTIKVVIANSDKSDFEIIEELSLKQADILRKKLKLV